MTGEPGSSYNPWWGCNKVSKGCQHCYAERIMQRLGLDFTNVQRTRPHTFNAPLRWKEPRMVFTCSMGDFFHETADPWRDEVWDIIRRTPQHIYQILTKRPERISSHLPTTCFSCGGEIENHAVHPFPRDEIENVEKPDGKEKSLLRKASHTGNVSEIGEMAESKRFGKTFLNRTPASKETLTNGGGLARRDNRRRGDDSYSKRNGDDKKAIHPSHEHIHEDDGAGVSSDQTPNPHQDRTIASSNQIAEDLLYRPSGIGQGHLLNSPGPSTVPNDQTEIRDPPDSVSPQSVRQDSRIACGCIRPIPWPWPSVWLGTSVENQEWADKRIPILTAIPATVHFLSCEPLLGPIDFDRNAASTDFMKGAGLQFRNGLLNDIEWVIVGGESGQVRRPMNLDWARAIRDQCKAASVPFFFKQIGGRTAKENGRLLDGRTYDAMPSVPGR